MRGPGCEALRVRISAGLCGRQTAGMRTVGCCGRRLCASPNDLYQQYPGIEKRNHERENSQGKPGVSVTLKHQQRQRRK